MIDDYAKLRAVALVMIPRARESVAQRAEGGRELRKIPGILNGAA